MPALATNSVTVAVLLVLAPMGGRLGPSSDSPKKEGPRTPPANQAAPDATRTQPQESTSNSKPKAPTRKTATKRGTRGTQGLASTESPSEAPADPQEPGAEPEAADSDVEGEAPLEEIGEPEPSLDPLAPDEVEYAAQGPAPTTPGVPGLVVVKPPPQRPLPERQQDPSPEPTLATSEDAPGSPAWKDHISWGAFVDTYVGVNALLPEPGTANSIRAFDTSNGFSVHWAGVDAQYSGDVARGGVSLRFGPSAAAYNGGDSEFGLEYVKQAYAGLAPRFAKGRLTVDLGKFDTLYGAEIADSQGNFNYTRGALNWLGQPFFHTGARIGIEATDSLSITAIVVNGWNNTLDNNRGKSGGVQLAWAPGDRFGAYLGYMVGAEGDREMVVACGADTAFNGATGECDATVGAAASETSVVARDVERRLRHFADLVVSASLTEKLDVSLNGDVGYDETIANPVSGAYAPSIWYGAAVGARYGFTERFATALRGEYYADEDGFTTEVPVRLGTATLTLECRPSELLTLKLDSRYDQATEDIFSSQGGSTTDRQLTFTLGAVFHTPR